MRALLVLQVDELRNKLDHKNKLIEKKTQEALQVIPLLVPCYYLASNTFYVLHTFSPANF